MDFTGRYVIAAAPNKVWDALNNPAVLKDCITGCEQLDKTSPTDFVATVKLKIGPLSAVFKGKVALSDLDPPTRCRLTGEGQGGVAGFAKGSAEVVLTPERDGTVLTYTANASVGGKLAQIGQRLIDGAAKQIADDFFKRFAAALEVPSLLPDPEVEAPSPMAKQAAAEQPNSGISWPIWVSGLTAVIVILLLLFGVRI
jgi:carbon monoxide dehydrogenase subunit G